MSSKIEWTESTWSPVIGCSKVSAGCTHCYAERMAKRLAGMENAYFEEVMQYAPAGSTFGRKYSSGIVSKKGWTGKIYCDETKLEVPLHWRKPRRIFVCSMSDLFHEKVPFEFIDKTMAVMIMCHQHTYQVLTKRVDRMLEYFSRPNLWTRILPEAIPTSLCLDNCIQEPVPSYIDFNAVSKSIHGPIPNLWLGVTVENQDNDWRIAELRKIQAAIKFVSFEPFFGPISDINLEGIDWVIVGGESGPGARPMHPDWVRGIRDQCIAANVPFFFKQWGEWLIGTDPIVQNMNTLNYWPNRITGIGSDKFFRVTKKKAGCILDGREWKQYPKGDKKCMRDSLETAYVQKIKG